MLSTYQTGVLFCEMIIFDDDENGGDDDDEL